jgi:PAS domain S-box-containing protein
MVLQKRPNKPKGKQSPEMEELRAQLDEANETLRAIREGEVDAVIVSGSKGEQVFSLVGAESIYRLIVETMKEAAFTVTFEGKILYCNARLCEFVKRPINQILGHYLSEFVDPANRSEADTLLATAQEQPVKQRLVFACADGCMVPAHISANVLNQPDGLSICVVATDLTELENSTEMIQQLRRQQEALQASNEELAATEEELRVQNEELMASRLELDRTRARYQDLFETAPDGYIATDEEGIIQEVNQAASLMFSRTATELKGNPFSALLPISEREAYLELLAYVSAGEVLLPKWELELQPPECPSFWAAVTAAASRSEEGNIVGLRWLIRDVTERNQQEAEIRRAKDELELRVRERTEELAIQADRLRALAGELTLAEQRERTRLAKVLHDHIQQLLVAAKMHVAVLGRDVSDKAKKVVGEIESLIDESIAASRSLTSELSPPVLHEGGLNAGLEWLARWMSDKQRLRVDLEMEPVIPLPETTKILLFESARELLLNTVKHSNSKSARINLKAADGFLHLLVSDEGVGFDPQAMPDAGESDRGFGLFSIRERLRLIGGQLEIESAPGKGSRFVLSVPLNQPAAGVYQRSR